MIKSSKDPHRADIADVRNTNLAVVLRCVRERAPCSRADVAAATGLNKTTVSSLVAELLQRRLLRETGLTGNRVGRPAVTLTLDGASYAAIGIEVNAYYLSAVAVDLAGRPVLSWRRAFPGAGAPPHRAVTAVAALARRVITRAAQDGQQVLGLAVALPALVDSLGRTPVAPGLGWRDVDFAGELTRALRSPEFAVEVGNDANYAVLAEHRFGQRAGRDDLVYLTGESGLGAGIIMDGALRRGGAGYSGEIGHIQITLAGPPCRCGRSGCLEAVAGIAAVIRRCAAGSQLADDGEVSPAELELEVDNVVARANSGHAPTLAALEESGRDLGRGIAVLANIVNPGAVIMGGHYAPLSPWLLPPAAAAIREASIAPELGGTELLASTLGPDAPALGAASRILDAVESGQLPRDWSQLPAVDRAYIAP